MTAPAATSSYLLPASAYTSREWFAREQRELFVKRWSHVGAIEDVSEPGDYFTATVGTAPMIVVRGDDGELRAFHNICRHRGMTMLDGAGNCGTGIDCFYHRWRYALDGDLVRVPQRKEQFPDIDMALWGLMPGSIAVWEGLVFVHVDPNARPFEQVIAGLAANIGTYRPGALKQVATRSFLANCNWKLFVENHIDVYHLWYLHAESLGDFDHTQFEYVQVDSDWFSYEPLREDHAGLNRGTETIAHISERDRLGIGAHFVFPNTMIATSAEFVATYVAVPIAPDQSRIDLRIRAETGADAAGLTAAAASFIEEDIHACERVQAAVASPAFAVGPMARDHEHPITVFQAFVLAGLDEGVRG